MSPVRGRRTLGRMESVAFALPLLAGHTDADRAALASCWKGARREQFADARRRAGVIREAVWIQQHVERDVAVTYLEADDLGAALTMLASSIEPFDRWYRDHISRVHGVTLDTGLPRPEKVLDFDVNRI